MRARTPVHGNTVFALTRLPMGACFAPHVAQHVTWAIVLQLHNMPGVTVDTMLDNVRVAADTAEGFIAAFRTVLSRCHAANITVNDASTWQADDHSLLQRASVTQPLTFLGETYLNGRINNAEHNLSKLRDAMAVLEGETAPTKRHVASIVGLILFMLHTVSEPLSSYHGLIRRYSDLMRDPGDWDESVTVTATMADDIRQAARSILSHEAVPLPTLRPPSLSIEEYDYSMIVDASKAGWGAILRQRTGEIAVLSQQWPRDMKHSAQAEPWAVVCCLAWLKEKMFPNRPLRLAVVTDHMALATGQLRWSSHYGGFSAAFHLNAAFAAMSGPQLTSDVFFVEGSSNPANGPSSAPKGKEVTMEVGGIGKWDWHPPRASHVAARTKPAISAQ